MTEHRDPNSDDFIIARSLEELETQSQYQTDGMWLEHLIADVAPLIREWDVDGCWRWGDWPEREHVMPEGIPSIDVGIDLVARRRSDGKWIAIQAKSRKLDEQGVGNDVTSDEMNKFFGAAGKETIWAERWLAVNGAVKLAGYSKEKALMSGAPVKIVNVGKVLHDEHRARSEAASVQQECHHCQADIGEDSDNLPIQTRDCMQREAVEKSVSLLREHEIYPEEGQSPGQARGKLILPCGAGKTRIALRIVEKLTNSGELSVVLCPSIALVAEIRREFLRNLEEPMRMMAVCSDDGVANNDEIIANDDDATIDRGLSTTDEITGCVVTTDAEEIAEWIRGRREGTSGEKLSVIFGTYQSASRVSEAIKLADAADGFKVLVCDEAHRTAGVRKKKRSAGIEDRLREFTLCHDQEAFPANYRVYQTATPRIYGEEAKAKAKSRAGKSDFVIRDMDDQDTFGVELYRRSYVDAVRNGWLSDYRIIAMAVGGKIATETANKLVRAADERAAKEAEDVAESSKKARELRRHRDKLPTTGDYLKGMAFALVMGGGATTSNGKPVQMQSCIGFLNTIARSSIMSEVLQSETVKKWVADQTDSEPGYHLEHLDASSPVAERDQAKMRLANATDNAPHGVLNVGIFGEGTDSPSLSAVAFLEPRKSPIDVVQAVGRAMRRAHGKEVGYIIAPVVIPPGINAEEHLSISDKHEGWQELGDILQALRAHDQRIEDNLAEMLTLQIANDQMELDFEELTTFMALGRSNKTRLEYAIHTGPSVEAQEILIDAACTKKSLLDYDDVLPIRDLSQDDNSGKTDGDKNDDSQIGEVSTSDKKDDAYEILESSQSVQLMSHIHREDNSTETRLSSPVRRKTNRNAERGPVNVRQTKRLAAKMASGERGTPLKSPEERRRSYAERKKEREAAQQEAFELDVKAGLEDVIEKVPEIRMNLLEKSGLTTNKVARDLNLLEGAVSEAARYLNEENALTVALDHHFGYDHLDAPKKGKPRADGSTVAALLWMNAAMLHQRIHKGGWLGKNKLLSLSEIKASVSPERDFNKAWNAITRQDFLPVIEPAIEALEAAESTQRFGGLRRALRHLAAEAEQIAETYADMGTDHAGALFNKVMGDQSSDGAFFTRPVAATLAARLTFDAIDPGNKLDWTDADTWRDHKTVDLACGSGTLLTAAMTEMKRRAELQGADSEKLAELQKVAVEEVIKGLDINPVSLQLAATQLMSGNTDVKYRKMGLHQMPYGPQPDGTVAAGTPELFASSEIVNSGRLFDDNAKSATLKTGAEEED